ncbi:NADP oxidoreductase [Aureimonas sp. Leaf454]|uniref:NADPH-dependent F420 reductase n=1 Tax=Aureimonas sp. Leaf454 TaxID=1736381 RepID=UPI0006FA035E|nr:NAD(P)-binding domain-containing protein [Aureimonas sp. Leaf454]KQT53748.1 NADP oxidoreductase [Aureimonas sp. Leaf454]
MSIGIIGSGALGSTLARAFAANGIAATISNSRGPGSLADLVAELGPSITAGTVEEAAAADIVIAAMRWTDAERVLGALPAWNNRIVIDALNPLEFLEPGAPADPSNPLAAYGVKALDIGSSASSSIFETWVAGARVVKAFNHLDARVLTNAAASGGQRVLFYSGDDAGAKADVRKILDAMGFFAIDLGPLAVGAPLAQLPFGPLSTVELVKI